MKMKMFLCFAVFTTLLLGCSKDAEDAANSSGFSASDINGIWKETTTGFTMRISGVSASGMGYGTVYAIGTAFPASALGGTCLKEVELIRGGYWEGYNQTYTGSSWYQGSVIGLAMTDSKNEFKIGTKVYKRQ
jgi:hypothetical protein